MAWPGRPANVLSWPDFKLHTGSFEKLTNVEIGCLQHPGIRGSMIFPPHFGKIGQTLIHRPVQENGQTDKYYVKNDMVSRRPGAGTRR